MKKITLFLFSFLVCFNVAFACINDRSSIYFEQQRFPKEDELIAGKFQIHSQEFHQWRIKDRLEKLKTDPNNAELLDDLAVSYDKTGNFPKAIEILNGSLKKNPNRYGTLANLGTFYIHHKEYQKGLELLKKAIKINPQAHYGREIYQIKIVEYVLSQYNAVPNIFPIQKNTNFSDYILKDIPKEQQKDELIRAIVGLNGMLKFGNSDSPILLEGLGDLYDRLYSHYTFFENKDNPLILYSKRFYIASFFKFNSNPHDYSILKKFLNDRNIDFDEKNDINNIKYDIEEGNISRRHYMSREQEILLTFDYPEEQIYKELFPMPEKQANLFYEKHEDINKAINYSKRQFISKLMVFFGDILGILSLIVLIVSYLSTTIIFNLLLLKNFKNDITSTDKQNLISGFVIFNFLLLLFLTSVFSSYSLFDLGIPLLFLGILAICFLIFIQWVDFNSVNFLGKKYFNFLRFVNKYSFYLMVLAIILNIIIYSVMHTSGEIRSIQ